MPMFHGVVIVGCLAMLGFPAASLSAEAVAEPVAGDMLRIGWAQADITPQRTASLGGMPTIRIASEAIDPLTATALAIEAPYQVGNTEPVIMISCDLRGISTTLLEAVRDEVKKLLPDFDPMRVILNATHTHNAPPLSTFGIPTDAMDEPEYIAFAAPRVAVAAAQAWNGRRPGGISYGVTQAVVGRNRLVAYLDGRSKMYGQTNAPDFSHIEGYEDHSVNVLCTWDGDGKLTGMAINLAATAQTTQSKSVISADFWHDTREEARRRFGKDLFILPQCSAAGDQEVRVLWDKNADARMLKLTGRNQRQEIAVRIANAVASILPVLEKSIEWKPVLRHRGEVVNLTRRLISEQDVTEANEGREEAQAIYDKAMRDLAEKPDLKNNPQWLRETTRAYREMRRGRAVQRRFELQQVEPQFPAELHVIRLGDMAIATNPFELYLDFGIQIKAHSRAVQTFLVQLSCGHNGYVPTERSVAGGAYGAVPASTNVGPGGGRDLVNWTVTAINELWPGD